MICVNVQLSRLPGALLGDVGVAYPQILSMPVKLCLEFITVISSVLSYAEREYLDVVIALFLHVPWTFCWRAIWDRRSINQANLAKLSAISKGWNGLHRKNGRLQGIAVCKICIEYRVVPCS